MDNIILRKTLSFIWKLLLFYSVYMLLRGHNEPGGGFIGGLLLATAMIMRSYGKNHQNSENYLIIHFNRVLAVLLASFMFVVILPPFFGKEILKGLWSGVWVPIAGKFSSVLVFDVAVYLIVAASVFYAYKVLSNATFRGLS